MADGDFPLLTFQGWATRPCITARGAGTAWPSSAGSASTTSSTASPTASNPTPTLDCSPPRAAASGSRPSTSPTAGPSRTTTTSTSSPGWRGCGPISTPSPTPPPTSWSWGTGTSPPRTVTCTTPKAFEGATHVSDRERKALDEIKGFGLVDVFRQRYEDGGLYSWWDYRGGNFHKKMGLRIDYLLASRSLAARSVERSRRPQRSQGPEAIRPRSRPRPVLRPYERRSAVVHRRSSAAPTAAIPLGPGRRRQRSPGRVAAHGRPDA